MTVSGWIPYGVHGYNGRRLIFASMAFRGDDGQRVPLWLNHDAEQVIGTATIDDQPDRLCFVAEIASTYHAAVAHEFRSGRVSGVSVGWRNALECEDIAGRTVIRRAALREISILTRSALPAFPKTHCALSTHFLDAV
jgi:HK97 family phage prohead protease